MKPRIPDWLRHAFAVEKAEDFEPTPEQRELVDKLVQEVIRRRLVAPALVTLEMSRPLNFLSSQALHFFNPMITTVTNSKTSTHLAEMLEHRGSIEFLIQQLEDAEEKHDAAVNSNAGGESDG
ncbi:hypothetical protein [Thalassoroseus pseudoceratinae]|uniref:hypothetical protein n=1 Tax=Thalassoroseus pseudoceratinae TaxID=2713176 RepID=UPI0014203B36|nr:hypothetical protein [Thalassoroseus pseudoceratinae]